MYTTVLPIFQRAIISYKGPNILVLEPKLTYIDFYMLIFHKSKQICMAKKLLVRCRIIVFQKLLFLKIIIIFQLFRGKIIAQLSFSRTFGKTGRQYCKGNACENADTYTG